MADNVKEATMCYSRADKAYVIWFFYFFHFAHLYFYSLKTGLLKWTPDFEIAANEYSKAGNV